MSKYSISFFILIFLTACATTPSHEQAALQTKLSMPDSGVRLDTEINRSPDKNNFKIEIIGSSQFKQQVTRALTLLQQNAPDKYEIVEKYIGKIEENKRSGMLADKKPPVYQMSLKTALYSITWCAGTIAHDAYHSKLYHDYVEKYGNSLPYDEWAGFEAEKKCIKFQLKTLRKIQAPKNEIDYCISLDGTHSDVNHDGRIDWTDYDLREW